MDKKYLKSVGVYALSALLSLLLIAYVLYHLLNGLSGDYETMAAELVTRYESSSFNAYIMRDEKLLFAASGGDVSYLVADGKKVAADTPVLNVYAADNTDLRNRVIELDSRITLLRQSNAGKDAMLSGTALIDKQIQELYYVIRSRTEAGDLSYAVQKRNELLVLLNRRRIIVGSVQDYNSLITQLENEKASLTASMQGVAETVSTPTPGYFYSLCDGYEAAFDSSKVDELTVPAFDEMISSEPRVYTASDEGYVVGKLVRDYVWYAVCETDTDKLRFFETGREYPVMFPYSSDKTVDMTLYRTVTQSSSGRVLLVFRSTVAPDGFNYQRMQAVEIVQQSYDGYLVPASAVRVVDGVRGVYILNGNVVLFRRINAVYEQDGNLIVSEADPASEYYKDMLKLNELVIIKGKDLYDGKIIG